MGTDKRELLLYFHNKETGMIKTFTLSKLIDFLYETEALDKKKTEIFINRNDMPEWLRGGHYDENIWIFN